MAAQRACAIDALHTLPGYLETLGSADASLESVRRKMRSWFGADYSRAPASVWYSVVCAAADFRRGDVLVWAQGQAQQRGVCVAYLGNYFVQQGWLDMLRLLQDTRQVMDTCSACRGGFQCHETDWLNTACRHLHVPVVRWVLDVMAARGLSFLFWCTVHDLTWRTTAQDLTSDTAAEHISRMAVWDMLVSFPGAYACSESAAYGALKSACRANNLPFARFLFRHLSGSGAWACGACQRLVKSRKLVRVASEYAPHVACWLYSLNSASNSVAWSARDREQVEAQPLAVWVAAIGSTMVRFAWIGAVLTQTKMGT